MTLDEAINASAFSAATYPKLNPAHCIVKDEQAYFLVSHYMNTKREVRSRIAVAHAALFKRYDDWEPWELKP